MRKAFDKIKASFEENPLEVITVGTLAAGVGAKVLQVAISARNSRTWRKEVNRRVKKAKKNR